MSKHSSWRLDLEVGNCWGVSVTVKMRGVGLCKSVTRIKLSGMNERAVRHTDV
jgi:hypothetical protein